MSWDSEPPLPKSLDDDDNLSRLREQALRSMMDEEQADLGPSDSHILAAESVTRSPVAATVYGGPPPRKFPLAPVYGGPPMRPPAPPDPPAVPPPTDDPDK